MGRCHGPPPRPRRAASRHLPLPRGLLCLPAGLNRRGSTRTTITDLPAEPKAPRPEQASTAPSRGNAVKATLLLLLGIGIAILLFTSPWFWLLLLAGFAVWVLVGLLGFIWKAIYDTLQEEDQPPPP